MKSTVDLKIQISQIDVAIEELKAEKTRLESLLDEHIEQNNLEIKSKQIATMLKENDGLEYNEKFRRFDYYDEDGRFVFTYNVDTLKDEDLEDILLKVSDAISAYQIFTSHFDFNRFSIKYSSEDRDTYHIFSNKDNVNVRMRFVDSSKMNVTVIRSFGVNEYSHIRTYLTDTTSIITRPNDEATVDIEDNQTIDLISDLDSRFDQMVENVNQYRIVHEDQDR